MRCHPARRRSGDDVRSIVRRLLSLIERGTPILRRSFGTTLDAGMIERLFEAQAFETILLDLCSDVGLMMSRAPQGTVVASVAIADLDIERSFQGRGPLAVALTGAIATAWLDVLEKTRLPN